MNIVKEYDVFLAFHDSGDINGSREQAKQLYDRLTEAGISCFLFSEQEESVYKANFIKIMQAKLLILVCNETIARIKTGELDAKKNYHLYVELDTFLAMAQSDKINCSVNDAAVVCFSPGSARSDISLEKIHPLFDQRNSFFYVNEGTDAYDEEIERVIDWVEERLDLQQEEDFSPELLFVSNQRKLDLQNLKIPGYDFRRILRKATSIKCLGISNWTFSLTDGCIKLKNALKRGVSCEMLFLNPDGEYVKLRAKEESKDTRSQITSSFDMIKAELKNVPSRKECFKSYVYDLVPRDNLIFIYSSEGSFVLAQNYSHALPGSAAPQYIYVKRQESPIFEYYEGIYQYVRNHERTQEYDLFRG